MSHTHCQTFGRKIQELRKQTETLSQELEMFLETGDARILTKSTEHLAQCHEALETFRTGEYRETLRKLYGKWFHQELHLPLIDIDMYGMVSIDRLAYAERCSVLPSTLRHVNESALLREFQGLTSLANLTEVVDKLDCHGCHSLASAPMLRRVGDYAEFEGTSLTSLPSLESAYRLDLENVHTFTAADRLRTVEYLADFRGTALRSLPVLESVGHLNLRNVDTFTSAPVLRQCSLLYLPPTVTSYAVFQNIFPKLTPANLGAIASLGISQKLIVELRNAGYEIT